VGLAAGQHELLQKQTNFLGKETYACRGSRMESSAGCSANSSVSAGRASSGSRSVMYGHHRRWGGGRQRGLGSRLPDHWNRFDPELRTSIASKPSRCQPVPRWLSTGPPCTRLHTGRTMPVAACRCRSCCGPASPRPLLVSGFCIICVTLRLHVTQRQQQRTIESCTRELHADSCCSAEVGPRPLPREPGGASTSIV
jgi:hypothetical protein